MASRDPQTPSRDHTVAVLIAGVTLVGLGVTLMMWLEWTDSPHAMIIAGMLAGGVAAFGRGLSVQIKSTQEGVLIASRAAATAEDTNQRTQDIQHRLNGDFEPRVRSIVAEVIREDLQPEIRRWMAEVLEERDVNCQTPQQRRRRN